MFLASHIINYYPWSKKEYGNCLTGLTAILREAWNIAQNSEDRREKVQALSLAKECYSMKMDLLTNATVVDDAIRFVSLRSNEKQKVSDIINDDKEKSNEPDYDEDKDELEEEPDYGEDEDQLEEKQEEESGEISITTNQVF